MYAIVFIFRQLIVESCYRICKHDHINVVAGQSIFLRGPG